MEFQGFQLTFISGCCRDPAFFNNNQPIAIKRMGLNSSVPRKSEMAGLLKQRMLNQQFYYPLLNWERPYRGDICTELNVERYDLRRDGNVGFSHPWGTHDDVFWSVALAVYATADMGPEPFLAVVPRG